MFRTLFLLPSLKQTSKVCQQSESTVTWWLPAFKYRHEKQVPLHEQLLNIKSCICEDSEVVCMQTFVNCIVFIIIWNFIVLKSDVSTWIPNALYTYGCSYGGYYRALSSSHFLTSKFLIMIFLLKILWLAYSFIQNKVYCSKVGNSEVSQSNLYKCQKCFFYFSCMCICMVRMYPLCLVSISSTVIVQCVWHVQQT